MGREGRYWDMPYDADRMLEDAKTPQFIRVGSSVLLASIATMRPGLPKGATEGAGAAAWRAAHGGYTTAHASFGHGGREYLVLFIGAARNPSDLANVLRTRTGPNRGASGVYWPPAEPYIEWDRGRGAPPLVLAIWA